MISRLSSFIRSTNKNTLFRHFIKEKRSDFINFSTRFYKYFRKNQSVREGKLNFNDQLFFHFGDHRSGWNYAVQSLRSLHNPDGIFIDCFIERTFAWNPKGIKPHRQSWIGFIHVPPKIPSWFPTRQSNLEIFGSEAWQASYPFCKGLLTLSEYHKKYLQSILKIPIENLLHPTEFPYLQWNPERFEKNREKKIIQVGWWLRKLYSIYLLPVKRYKKIFLRKDESGMDELLAREFERTPGKEKLNGEVLKETKVVNFLPDKLYDQLLSENILFLDLYDSSANNAIIECIARNTPILVNPLEAVIEYLGRDYPLYFRSLEEAAMKADNFDLIRQAYEYLRDYTFKAKLTGDYFRESLVRSTIYQNL